MYKLNYEMQIDIMFRLGSYLPVVLFIRCKYKNIPKSQKLLALTIVPFAQSFQLIKYHCFSQRKNITLLVNIQNPSACGDPVKSRNRGSHSRPDQCTVSVL